jgi:hypothetical protein
MIGNTHMQFFRLLQTATLWLGCTLVVLLYGSLGRPIWIDEFLHFATGSFDSTAAAWSAIAQSTANVNHGQTGIYMLVDYWLLTLFGADLVALRAPSLISAFLLCLFTAKALQIRGHSFSWQALAVFVMGSQSYLMYYAGEARPYMPLAMSCIGTAVYALATAPQRDNLSIKLVGIFSIISGVLMHPYFALYWLSLFIFGFWFSWFNGQFRFTIKDITTYLNVPLCVVGTAIYFLLASQTWLTGSPEFNRDPFEYISRADFYRLFVWHQSTFMGFPDRGEKLFAVSAVGPLIYFFLPPRFKTLCRPMIPPMVLIDLALLLTSLISLASYYQHYWILTRQWVGSIALIALAFTWLCAEIVSVVTRALPRQHARWVKYAGFLLILLYCWRSNAFNSTHRWHTLVDYFKQDIAHEVRSPPDSISCPITPEQWVDLANQNLRSQMSVWPIFKFYYLANNIYCKQ